MRKSAPLVQVKAGPSDGLDEGQFVGYASVFGNKDSYGDIVQPGAFKETLADWEAATDNLPVLWGHDMGDPFSNIGVVTAAEEDERGLKVTARLDLDNPKAAQVYRLLKNRAVGQMSFAYDVLEGHSVDDEQGGYYSLDKLKLYEVSIVPIGANQETEILAVKAAEQWPAVEKVLREMAAKAGRAISAKTEASIRAAFESAAETQQHLKDVLALVESEEDQEKARTNAPADADEEPDGAKSEQPARTVPAERLARQERYLALVIEGEGGSQ